MTVAKEWHTFHAVFSRNMKLFTSYTTWVVATIIWPIPLLALNIYQYLGLGTDQTVSAALAQNYGIPSFSGMIIVGTVVYLLYNRLLWGTGTSIQQERWMGTIEALFLTPTNRLTVLFASGTSSLVEGSWWISSIFLLSWFFFGIQPNVGGWPAVVLTVISTMIALIAVGVFFASFFVLTRAAENLASALQAPIRFFSGVAFPVAALPQVLQYFSFILPTTYGIQALRNSLLMGADLAALLRDMMWLYVFAVLFVGLGYVSIRIVEKKAKKDGTLYLM